MFLDNERFYHIGKVIGKSSKEIKEYYLSLSDIERIKFDEQREDFLSVWNDKISPSLILIGEKLGEFAGRVLKAVKKAYDSLPEETKRELEKETNDQKNERSPNNN